MIDVNTTSVQATHFLRAVELIIEAREKYRVPSENWPYPTEYKLGTPCEEYYAEVWIDGMDWQNSYWAIEEKNLQNPQVKPFIIFEKSEERELFNNYDFGQLVKGSLWYRRDKFWIKRNSLGIFTDTIWPYLKIVYDSNQMFTNKYKELIRVEFKHASQPKVAFWMNEHFIPVPLALLDHT